MPTYTYRREDGSTFEIEQRITEDALETCPTTGQTVSRIITGGTGLVFKGSGFYLTDYARKSASTPAENKGSADTASPKDSSSSETSESKTPKKEKAAASGSDSGSSSGKDS